MVVAVHSAHVGQITNQPMALFRTKRLSSPTDTTNGLCRDNAEEDGFPYDLCIIMVGTNDLGHDYKPHEVFESVVGLHQTCHRHGVPTIAISIPPNSFTHGTCLYQNTEQMMFFSGGVGGGGKRKPQ